MAAIAFDPKVYRAGRAWFGTRWDNVSVDDLKRYRREQIALLERARKDAEEATRFRPSFAPVGKLTRSESGTRAVVAESEKFVAYLTNLLILKMTNKPLTGW